MKSEARGGGSECMVLVVDMGYGERNDRVYGAGGGDGGLQSENSLPPYCQPGPPGGKLAVLGKSILSRGVNGLSIQNKTNCKPQLPDETIV